MGGTDASISPVKLTIIIPPINKEIHRRIIAVIKSLANGKGVPMAAAMKTIKIVNGKVSGEEYPPRVLTIEPPRTEPAVGAVTHMVTNAKKTLPDGMPNVPMK